MYILNLELIQIDTHHLHIDMPMKTCSIGQTLHTCDLIQLKRIKDVPKIKHGEYGLSKITPTKFLKMDTKFPQNQL